MTPNPLTAPAVGTIRRCTTHRMVAGVASGLAEYLDVDPLLVRIAFVVLAALDGIAVPLYLALWLLVPADDAPASVAEDLVGRLGRF
ncbi:MAG: PspC domain-containing protein [Acidimicrobiales bacterium]